MTFDPYSNDENYFRWLVESSYGDFIQIASHHIDSQLFQPLQCLKMQYYVSMAQLIDKYFLPAQGKSCLDCGCGLGRLSFHAATRELLVTGIDSSAKFVEFCISLLEASNNIDIEIPEVGHTARKAKLYIPDSYKTAKASFFVGDISNLQFMDKTFSYIVSSNVVDRVEDPFWAVQEMHRVLQPGGRALVSSPLDWRTIHTPNEQKWVNHLTNLFPLSDWKLLEVAPAIEYSLRISDRLIEYYICDVLVAEKI